jgi:hypothetical protein
MDIHRIWNKINVKKEYLLHGLQKKPALSVKSKLIISSSSFSIIQCSGKLV